MYAYDVLIVGSGIAGLSFATKVAEAGYTVGLITKKDSAESNTNYAQGGIAAVTSKTDDVEMHLRDTLEAGDGLVKEAIAREILSEGASAIDELRQIGVDFTHLDDGRISLGKEGGHSKRRVLHVQDVTGRAIEEALLHKLDTDRRIEVFEHTMAIDLLTVEKLRRLGHEAPDGPDRVLGLHALEGRTGEVKTIAARAVMLATGGVGHVYQYTTNPDIATGDGIAMAYRAGVPVKNVEFIQFHPTAFYAPTGERFLISEAVRGEGAVLRGLDGEAFMKRYHPRGDLASRDHVARAIDAEMKKSGSSHVWLDITHKDRAELEKRFPAIFAHCLRHGIDISKDYIPVVPAAHYFCGGVEASVDAETPLPGLYACGEVACTGLHGANRLASNSLLEAVVMARRGARAVTAYLKQAPQEKVALPAWVSGAVEEADERVVVHHNTGELQRAMWDYVGIVRTTKRLERARTRLANLRREVHDYYWNFQVERGLLELRNLIEVASLIVEAALQRKESRGLHYTLDFPGKRPVAEDTVLRRSFERTTGKAPEKAAASVYEI